MTTNHYILELKEYDMVPGQMENKCITKHYTKESILTEIKDNGRLDWWFESNEIDEDTAKKYNIMIDQPYEIFNKSFDEFWNFYINVIGTYPVQYDVIYIEESN